MNYLRRNWYNFGLAVAVGVLIYVSLAWKSMDVLQRLLLLNFVALLLHQFEEYGWPGGEPAIMNMVLQPSDTPDRYPLNQNSAMITNVVVTYIFYLLPVFFSHVIWLGLATMLFGLSQFIVHGILTNRKLRAWYNPGLAAVVLLHIPLAIAYIYYITANGLASGWDWLIAIVYMGAVAFIVVNKMTYTWLADKNSPYVFDKVELQRFHVPEKLERLRAGKPG
ncbi:MAG TPA: HXXEE domain-containing protein [Anaerolineales bacterium]|nr:HXXEE domain-containing protein [Anaerolineales bacterium]